MILISMKKDTEYISVNTIRATTQRNGFRYIPNVQSSHPEYIFRNTFSENQWKSPYVRNN